MRRIALLVLVVLVTGPWTLQAKAQGQRASGAETARAQILEGLRIVDTDSLQVLKTQDGSTNIGRITGVAVDSVEFQTRFGAIHIPVTDVKEIRVVPKSSVRDGEYWFPNPNTTRLLFSPTARMLRQGRAYFADYWLVFPGIAYGLTDNFTIGGGVSVVPGAGSDQIIYFTPKLGIVSNESGAFAVGALIVKPPEDSWSTLGILYGVATLGGPAASGTFGLGYGYADSELADQPFIVAGGEMRLTKRTAFVTENWYYPGESPVVSGALRFFGEKLSVDLGLFTSLDEHAPKPGLPYLDFVYYF